MRRALPGQAGGARAPRRAIPYIDPFDIRYNRFEQQPEPNTNAVMFCLMDVSGSMGEREKDLAKRFFILLHLFLKRRYERIDVVFIRHTHEAQEVDEETFFYSRETGGTVVSTALREMLEGSSATAIRPASGTSTRPRPPTATTSPATRSAASPCCATRSCRSASTTPMSRSSTSARWSCSRIRTTAPRLWQAYRKVSESLAELSR